jgi:hypothetical protein
VWLFIGVWITFTGMGLALFLFELQILEHHVTKQNLKIKIWSNISLKFNTSAEYSDINTLVFYVSPKYFKNASTMAVTSSDNISDVYTSATESTILVH